MKTALRLLIGATLFCLAMSLYLASAHADVKCVPIAQVKFEAAKFFVSSQSVEEFTRLMATI